MARDISSRLILSGDIIAQTPLHVGGYGEDVDTDLPLAHNGAGHWYIPGTSFAGALRSWCGEAFPESIVKSIWGFQDEDQGHASHVFIEDAEIDDGVVIEIRDGVGIDRLWGTAAEHIKFDRAILPRGTKILFQLIVEIPTPTTSFTRDDALAMLAAIRDALKAGEIRLGASKTRGLGKVKLGFVLRICALGRHGNTR
ncbi:MAG: hypothetical protein GC154_16945 [bacterium]|nr:hypothetical protein [bacterium]